MKATISRRSNIEPFHAMDVLAEANRLKAAGVPVISMAVGQPSDPAPLPVREAAARVVRDGRIGYTDALGLMSLREAIARHYVDHYGIEVPPQRIVATTGSSAAFNLAFLAMFDAGDRVAITAPGYPAYRNILKVLGIEAVEIDLGSAGYLKAALDPDTVVINSFSKYYCMTGWRIGWMVLPEQLLRPVERIQQSLYISAPEISQHAAIRAFEATGELEAVKARYAESRRMLLDRLPRLGFGIAAPPDGAFYAYCDVSRHTNDSMDFARRMIAEAHVAATPGHDFDPVNGHRTMRFSYAGSPADMVEAMDRLERWLGRA